ncbi:MAG: CoA ester lyase [Pseudomonadota bacterium]
MPRRLRPRRSILYLPGSNPRALEKAKTLPADGYIFDLEDAVAPDAKEQARDQVCAAVKAGGYGARELVIRVNGLDTDWAEADIAAASAAGPDAILLPKVESPEQVHTLARQMQAAGAPENTEIWVMMETPRAMFATLEIASAHEKLACLVMGTSDLVKDLHAHHTPMRMPVITSLSLCLLAARAEGLAILDGVYADLKDETGFAQSCRQGVEMGFDGKTLVHPNQIGPANAAFAPDADEVDFSRRIIAAHAEATAQGKGIVVVDNKMIEGLHVDNAKRLVALADAIAQAQD